jgi:outer membrane protein TolC
MSHLPVFASTSRRAALITALACAVLTPLAPHRTQAAPAGVIAPASTGTVEEGLRQVVDDALAANLELRAGTASVAQRLAALDQARARYLPVLDFAGRYSVADGGRTIEFPVGDLLNPVYETLDQMLAASGQPPRFPRVQNEEIAFLRSHEQETKFVLEQPLYEPRIGPAVEAGRQQVNRAEANLSALRSRVIRDTKQAYYQWLAAQQAVLVIDATRDLARANLAANESLYRNGSVTRDLVYRAEADVLEIEQQSIAAASRVRIAQSYVNLLRNVALATPLPQAVIDGPVVERFRNRIVERLTGRKPDVAMLQALATDGRQELRGLDAAIAAGVAQQDLARAAFKPTLAFGAEAGMQGEDYAFGNDEKYVLASVILRFNTFRGGADRAALLEARAFTDELRATRDLAAQQVRLEVQQAYETLEVADASLETALKRTEAAAGAFRITSRKRDLGQINQAEFIDARRAYTDAQLNLTRVRTEFLGRLAELEYAIGDTRRLDPEVSP